MRRYRPIYIVRDGRILSVTTKSPTREHARKRYCEINEIGGKEALALETKTLDQMRSEKHDCIQLS